jgi:hypothetical protein
VSGGIFGALNCTQVERNPRNTMLPFKYNISYCNFRNAMFEGMRLQDGPDDTKLLVEFPYDKKKQFASKRDQKRAEKAEKAEKFGSPESASENCKKHNWVPHLTPNVVRLYLFVELNYTSVTKSI